MKALIEISIALDDVRYRDVCDYVCCSPFTYTSLEKSSFTGRIFMKIHFTDLEYFVDFYKHFKL